MQWFKELTSNERNLIIYGGVLVSIALFWVFVFQPINHSIRVKSNQKIEIQKQLKQMQSSERLFKIQSSNNQKYQRELNQPFNVWIDGKLLEKQLSQYVTRSEPKDAQTLILTFESVVFDDLISWLQPLTQNYNIHITEADVALTDRSNGLCNARITLEEK